MSNTAQTFPALSEILVKIITQDITPEGFHLVLYHDATDGIRSSTDPDFSQVTTEPSGYDRPHTDPTEYTPVEVNGIFAIELPGQTIDVSGVTDQGSVVDSVLAITEHTGLEAGSPPQILGSASLVEDIEADEVPLEVVHNYELDPFDLPIEVGESTDIEE